MRKTLGVAALMLAFCCPALAGEIPNPPAPQPPPASAAQDTADGVTLYGVMQNGVADSLTLTALELLAVLPSLF